MDLTKKFSLEQIKEILMVPLKDITNTTLLEESVAKDVKGNFGDFAFSADGAGGIKVRLFNDPDDDNDDPLATELRIEDEINKDYAFLSYEVNGKLKGGLNDSINKRLGLSVVREVTHQSFLKHSTSSTLAEAIGKDILGFKVAFDSDSLENLKNYEAVILRSKGAVVFSADLSISDTFTPILSKISKLVDATDSIFVKMDMSASIKVKLGISDSFQTVIQRKDKNGKQSYSVSISKESKSEKNIAAGIGVSAEISNPEVLNDAIDKIIERGEKGIIKELDNIKKKTFDDLSTKEKDLLAHGAALVGIDPLKIKDDLLASYRKKKASIVKTIHAVVESEIKFAVTYTYEKTKESKSILNADFTHAALKKYLKEIIGLRVQELYKLGQKNGIEVNEYFDLSKISIARSMKIGFSVSDFELSQLVKKQAELDTVTTYNNGEQDEGQSVHFSSSKFTVEKLGIFKERNNSLTLSGSYSGEAKSEIFMRNLDYGFSLHWSENYKKLDKVELKKAVDFAVTWGIVEESKSGEQLERLNNLLGKKKVKFSTFLKIEDGLFNSIVDEIIQLSGHQFKRALAASIPYADYQGRRTPSERMQFYYSFFDLYLKEKSPSQIDFEQVGAIIGKHLMDNGLNELADFEQGTAHMKYARLKDFLEHNDLARTFPNFKNAIKYLTTSEPIEFAVTSKGFLRNLNSVRLQPEFNMRFLGRLLLTLSEDNGIENFVERSMTIEYKNDKDKTEKYIIAR